LLAYTLLSFFIPFIDISTILGNNSGANMSLFNLFRLFTNTQLHLKKHHIVLFLSGQPAMINGTWTAFALMIGAGILLLRFIVRYISFIRIRNRSKLISADGIKIYQVDESIIPFSFGKSVFINSNLHTEDELRESFVMSLYM
jgi:hypothetical protein